MKECMDISGIVCLDLGTQSEVQGSPHSDGESSETVRQEIRVKNSVVSKSSCSTINKLLEDVMQQPV
ncbi:hypothetical protein JOB18_041819 [Solea senegalensis]|uniref:Uncharacterized protein n=1 Tax=Solea senegalensis TaxID=28829 RepID=A0AAV6SVN8_SOLSE|nr:hypothetical protein JOB18_041819 [Solea senegalensis]